MYSIIVKKKEAEIETTERNNNKKTIRKPVKMSHAMYYLFIKFSAIGQQQSKDGKHKDTFRLFLFCSFFSQTVKLCGVPSSGDGLSARSAETALRSAY